MKGEVQRELQAAHPIRGNVMNLLGMLHQAQKTAPPKPKERKAKVAPIRDSIVQYVCYNPGCTMLSIQRALGLSDRSVASWMHRLHKDGILDRTQYSSTFNGHRPRYQFYYKEVAR